MSSEQDVIVVDYRFSDEYGNIRWVTKKLIFLSRAKYEKALAMIFNEIGVKTDHVIVDETWLPLPDYESRIRISKGLAKELESLADRVETL